MKVFCPQHKKGFLAPRRNPIRCENKLHVLGDLDFEGQAKEPVQARWEYCCNCEHFWPRDVDEQASAQCPVCTRQLSLRYLCDRCYTISSESPTPAKTKNFTVTPEGAPQPSCPGCIESPASALRQHHCDEWGASFSTALTSCPVCGRLIGDIPPFPSPVGEYLNKIKAYQTVGVNYESDMLVAAEDGEFVLIAIGPEKNQSIILPRRARFTSKRDFYDNYQDYYVCENPTVGEVLVIDPAIVEKVEGGWKLREVGVLEVLGKAPQEIEGAYTLAGSPLEKAEPTKTDVEGEEETGLICPNCGTPGSPLNKFCWHCGKPLAPDQSRQEDLRQEFSKTLPSVPLESTGRTPTKVDSTANQPPLFTSTLREPPSSSSGGMMRVLIIAGLIGLIVLVIAFVLLRS